MTAITTKAARVRERLFREKLAQSLAKLAPHGAGVPQRGTRPQWVTPRVTRTPSDRVKHGVEAWNARRAGRTRGEIRFPVVNPKTCARFLERLPVPDVAPKVLPAPKRGPRQPRRRRKEERVDVTAYTPRYPVTSEHEVSDAGRSARPCHGKVDPRTGALL